MTESLSNQPSNLAEIHNLVFHRGKRTIFDGVSVNIARGKVTAIMGPSGCGKTTLLRFIGGQLRPDAGQVLVDGQSVPDLKRDELFVMRSKMGMLFQSGALFTDLSVYENVAFPLREHTQLSEALIRELVLMKLESVGLRGAESLMPAELSGGMNRRAALARAIALDPALIMYDEPFAGQDPIVKGVLVTLIRTLSEALGLTSVIVSHDIEDTLSIADYIYVLASGKIIGEGTPDTLRASESPFIQQFLNGHPDGPVHFRYPAQGFAEELAAEKLRAGGRT
ncbi:MAG: ATP-binding cassette domain-containing protein [bacterium]|nr:ATP-binding cassette domain-containing protein [bacterium]